MKYSWLFIFLVIALTNLYPLYSKPAGGAEQAVRLVPYMVRKSDPIGTIAKRFHVKPKELMHANKIRSKTYKAYPGRALMVPLLVRPKVWDPMKADTSSDALYFQDRRPTTDYEIITDFFDEYIKEDFISLAEAQDDSLHAIKIDEHISKIDKRVNYLHYKIDSLKQADFSFDYNERERNSVLEKMRRARDRYYQEGPIGKEIDSLNLVKNKLGEYHLKLRTKITDYEYLADNAAYNEKNFEKEDKKVRADDKWSDHLNYESDYQKRKSTPVPTAQKQQVTLPIPKRDIAAAVAIDTPVRDVIKSTPIVIKPTLKDTIVAIIQADIMTQIQHHPKVDFALVPKLKWTSEINMKMLNSAITILSENDSTLGTLHISHIVPPSDTLKEKSKNIQQDIATASHAKDTVATKPNSNLGKRIVEKAIVEKSDITTEKIAKEQMWDYKDSIAFVLRRHPHVIAMTHILGYRVEGTVLQRELDTQFDSIFLKREKKVNTDPLASYKTDSNFIMTTIELKDIPIIEYKNKPKYLMPVDSVSRIKAQFYLFRARQTLEKGDFKMGDKFLRKSLELNPNNAEAWMLHADLFLTTGSADKALKEYVISSEIDSTNPKVFYNIALLYAKANDDQKAYKYFSKATDANDKYLLAYMGRASLLMDQRDFEGAIEDYTKVLKINKYYSPAFKGRGLARMEVRRFSEAITDFNQYLEIEDPDGYIIYERGLSKVLSNNLLQGCLDFSSALELGFKDADKAIKRYCQ